MNKDQLLWKLQNRGKVKLVYTKIPDYDPNYHWYDTALTSVLYCGEEFTCANGDYLSAVDKIIEKYPETLTRQKDVEMVEFCRQYVNVLLTSIAESDGRIKTKAHLELANIVIGGEKSECGDMYNDDLLDDLFGKAGKPGSDTVMRKVYSFVRDNINLFVK